MDCGIRVFGFAVQCYCPVALLNANNGAFPSLFMIALLMIHELLPFLFNEESI
jgi:hypothetical protein